MFVVVTCIQAMTWACGSRIPAAVPVPQPATPPAPPSAAAVPPEAPPSPPASTGARTEPATDDCALVAAPGEPVGTVALSDRIDPSKAPHPSNDSERLLFRQLYETLVRADCMGRVAPGLAESWRLDGDGRTWIVTLREEARFSDGTPVTPADVKSGWSRDSSGGELLPHVSRLVESIVAVDDRALAIRLRSQRMDVPLALGHPDLAIAKYVADSFWPVGTRSWRIEPEAAARPAVTTSVITLVGDNVQPVRFLIAPADPRDLLDNGVDLFLTRDPETLDYAATLPQFQSVPLAWQRTHVLLTPGRSRSSPSLSEREREVLAEDAVRGEARGAQGPFWWEMLDDCEVAPAPPRSQTSAPRIVYDSGDAAARDLAERLVGLTRASGSAATAFLDVFLPDRPRRAFQRATGLTGEALSAARRLGNDAAYVMSVDSRSLEACRDVQVLMEGARWIDPATIVPLVDTRLHAVMRRGRSGATAEWDGGVVIAGGAAPR